MRHLLSGSIFVLFPFIFTVITQGSDIYKAIYDRANQRTTRTYLKSFHKYPVEHDALVVDVVENYKDISLVQQFEIFKKLTNDLGMAEMPVGSFNSRAVAARKQIVGFKPRVSRPEKVCVEASKLLSSFLEKDPNISARVALEALKLRGGCDLKFPSIVEVTNWLKYRKESLRFSEPREIENKNNKLQRVDEQVSAPPVSSSSSSSSSFTLSSDEDFWNDTRQALSDDYEDVLRPHKVNEQIPTASTSSASDDEFWNDMRQALSDDYEDVVQASDSFHSDRRGAAVEECVPSIGTSSQLASHEMFPGSQTYRTLLERANQRMAEAPVAWGKARTKYTSGHDDLILDIVQTFKKEKSLPKQYEFFASLLKDLHMVEMARRTFYQRAGAVRRGIAGYCRRPVKKPAVGVEASKSLEYIFEGNPDISEADAFKSLALNVNMDGESSLPLRRNVRSWLKYRRASRHILGEKHQQSQTSSSSSSDQDFWDDMVLTLRDPNEEDAHNVEALSHLNDEQSSRKRRITTQY